MSSPADVEIGVVPEPLTRWGKAWRILLCLLLGLVIIVSTSMELDSSHRLDRVRYQLVMPLDLLVLAPVLHVALWWHRRFPLWLSLGIILLSGISSMAAGASVLLFVSITTRRRWRSTLAAAVAMLTACLCYEYFYPMEHPLPLWMGLLAYTVLIGALVAWGLYIGARRELVGQWRWRAENAEVEQARQVAAAAQAERARIAREMHDVLAHRLSQVSLHAGALAYRQDLSPEAMRAEAETIRSASTAALDDLRSILGVLRNTETSGMTTTASGTEPGMGAVVAAPQPTAADLPALVAEAQGEATVELVDVTTAPLPATVGRHVYRMVQEALTNAQRHAPGAPVTVRLSGAPGGEVHLLVTNPPGGPGRGGGAGLGLVGLRERATILGGEVTAQPAVTGGWVVEARLPWPPTQEDA